MRVGALDADGPVDCNTSICKAFVGVGYVFFFMASLVVYKFATIWEEDHIISYMGSETEVQHLREIDFPDHQPDKVYTVGVEERP